MLSFATEFPVNHTHSSPAFLRAIRVWIVGSPHTGFTAEDLGNIDSQDNWVAHKGNERIESLGLSSTSQDAAAVRYIRNDRGLEWVSSIVFSRQESESCVGIRVSCESSHPAVRLPPAKKPLIVRTLLNELGGASDGVLAVRTDPHRLDDCDIDVAARLIAGRAGCRLPVVYVSSGFHGNYILDVERLAADLAGMAHVVVEPNRPFSLRLKIEVESENVYGGTIGVYWPDGGGRRSFFIGPEFDSPDDVGRAVFEEVRTALTNRRPLPRCTWGAVQEAVSRRAYDALKAAGSQEVDKYTEVFDKELRAKDERLTDAEKEIARLRAEVRRCESRSPMGSGLTIRTGCEQDLYPGEMAGVVRDALEDASTRVPADSRRVHVLAAILKEGATSEGAASMREQLKKLLRGSRSIDSKTRRGLEDMGFAITEEGKHFKLVFQGDARYTFTLSKSGSDHRGGLNAVSDISRLLF